MLAKGSLCLHDNVSTIYLLATEINALVAKRLHGLAHGGPAKIVIFQTMEQLPRTPEANSFLVIPESLEAYLTTPEANVWAKIFLLTMDPNRLTGSNRIIFLNSWSKIGVVWQKVVLPLINMGRQSPTGHSWHSINFSGVSQLNTLEKQIGQNKKFYGAQNLSSVQPLLLALTGAPAGIAACPITYNISIDANSLKVDFVLHDHDKDLLHHFIKIAINGAYDAQLWHHANAIHFSALINFYSSGNTHACLIDVPDAPCLLQLTKLGEVS